MSLHTHVTNRLPRVVWLYVLGPGGPDAAAAPRPRARVALRRDHNRPGRALHLVGFAFLLLAGGRNAKIALSSMVN